jgi:hypothetical protein
MNGLIGKAEPLIAFMGKKQIDVLLIQETHLLPQETSPIPQPVVDLRKPVELLSAKGGRRRRAGIQVHAVAGLRQQIDVIDTDSQSQNWAIVKIGELIIGTGYFAPNTIDEDLFNFLEKVEHIIDNYPTCQFVLAGDFNARIGAEIGDSKSCVRGRKLIKFLIDSPLSVRQMNQPCATSFGFGARKSGSIVDLALSANADISLVSALQNESCGGSDHCPIIFDVQVGNLERKNFERWNIRKLEYKWKEYEQQLSRKDVEQEIVAAANIDHAWHIFKEWIEWAAAETIGRFRYKTQPNTKFWTTELELMRKKIEQSVLQNRKRNVLDQDQKAFMEERATYQKLVTDRRTQVFNEMAQNMGRIDNSNALLKMISGYTARHKRTTCGLKTEDMEKHVNHFSFTFGKQCSLAHQEFTQTSYEANDTISEGKVQKAIASMANGKSPGPDGIHSELFKCGGTFMVRMMTALIRRCYTEGRTPKDWKEAVIAPVFKNKGSRLDAANYRPIAISNTCRRVYEKILATELDPNKLHDAQGGFRPRRSTQHQLWILDQILKRNKNVKVAFLDIKAAYDTVDRQKLYQKLHNCFQMPICGIQRIKELFEGIESRLVIKGEKSKPMVHHRGLLQGSSLSPMLFNFFINDLLVELGKFGGVITNNVKVNCLAFADDICLVASTSGQLQKLLLCCEKWAINNDIEFAPEKCQVLGQATKVKFCGKFLSTAGSCRYLGMNISHKGVEIDSSMAPRMKKAKLVLNMLASVGMNGSGFPEEASCRLFKQFVRPCLEYGLQIALPKAKTMEKLDLVQNAALRKIFSAPRGTSTNALRKLLQLVPFRERAFEIHAKFHAQLQVSKETTIPAVKLADKLNLAGEWKALVSNNHWWKIMTANPNKVLSKYSQKEKYWDILLGLDEPDRPSVSASIKMAQKRRPIHFVLSAGAFDCVQTRKTIINWMIGGVARHQNCASCGKEKVLSRAHALACSGANNFLHHRYLKASKFYLDSELGNSPKRISFLDFLLHSKPGKPSDIIKRQQFYRDIAYAIRLIYQNCLGYKLLKEGLGKEPQQGTIVAGGLTSIRDHQYGNRNHRNSTGTNDEPQDQMRSPPEPP